MKEVFVTETTLWGIKMFDWLFKKKPRVDNTITTESIIRNIENRRMRIDEYRIMSSKKRDKAIETLALFPLHYSVDELEVSLSCDIDWMLFITIMNRLIKEGKWKFVDETNRCSRIRRIQRVR